jgi:hypothetical protein
MAMDPRLTATMMNGATPLTIDGECTMVMDPRLMATVMNSATPWTIDGERMMAMDPRLTATVMNGVTTTIDTMVVHQGPPGRPVPWSASARFQNLAAQLSTWSARLLFLFF